jgi:hypothetical protein
LQLGLNILCPPGLLGSRCTGLLLLNALQLLQPCLQLLQQRCLLWCCLLVGSSILLLLHDAAVAASLQKALVLNQRLSLDA